MSLSATMVTRRAWQVGTVGATTRQKRGVTVRQRRPHCWVFTNHNGKRKAKFFTTKDGADTFAKKVEKAPKRATWNLALLDWKLPGGVGPAAPVATFRQYAETCLDAKEPNAQARDR